MRKIFGGVIAIILAGFLSFSNVAVFSTPAFADCAGANTSLLNCESSETDGIGFILTTAVRILVVLVGILGVVGVVISGIQYLTAGGNEAQVAKAKSRLLQVVIGLIAYGVMSVFLEWLIPGGIF